MRLALNRKVTVNSMAAGEKLFVDLLPEGWTGLPPGLPQEVVEELARRAREAEKKARAAAADRQQQRALPPVRVRVGVQPTFTRYTFALPALIAVSIDRSDDKMTMTFEAPLRFDLADVQAALPPMVAAIEAQPRPRQRRGALRVHRQGRRAHVPRGQQLRRRRPADPSARRGDEPDRRPTAAERRAGGLRAEKRSRRAAAGRCRDSRSRAARRASPPTGQQPPKPAPARAAPAASRAEAGRAAPIGVNAASHAAAAVAAAENRRARPPPSRRARPRT